MTSQRRLGLLFVLVGPPGVGKNTMMNAVLKRLSDLQQLPTATTRPIRPTEQQGREHLFVSRDQFQQMLDDNALIESQVIHGEWYGIPKATVERAINERQDLIADIDVLGATYVRSMFPDNAVLIFVQPASTDDLKRRMQARGETQAEIEKRMKRVEMEMSYAPLCDYLITNDENNIEHASEILYGIVLAERSRRDLVNLRADRELPRHKLAYVTTVIPLCEEDVLYQGSEPHFPTAQLAHGELPHEAALRALNQEFGLSVSQANLYPSDYSSLMNTDILISPIVTENHTEAHHQQIVFYYLYRLPDRINPPQGWNYMPFQGVTLPDALRQAIHQLLRDVPSHDGVIS